ncbi:MAG: response regulator [Tidjanibacter sp.]|nr:response regulator [Tidjanibacter sp.]
MKERCVPQRVLIAAPESGLRRVVSQLLEGCDVEVHAARSHEELVQLAQRGDYGLIVTRFVAPLLRNPQLVRGLVERGARLFVLSHTRSRRVVTTLLRVGVSQFLSLPISLVRLLRKMEGVLRECVEVDEEPNAECEGGALSAERGGLEQRMVVPALEYLVGMEPSEVLTEVVPSRRQRVALAGMVAELRRSFVECGSGRTRKLNRLWGLEDALLEEVCRGGRRGGEALDWLRYIAPSVGVAEALAERECGSPSEEVRALLVGVAASPSEYVALLAAHPHQLRWGDMELLDETLRLWLPAPPPIPAECAHESPNLALWRLYAAYVEASEECHTLALRYATSPISHLRTAACNVLMEEWPLRHLELKILDS